VNLCFGDPWDGSAYRWYLRREFAGRLPDLLVVRHPGEMVAGLGLNYRQVRLAGGALVEVGIVTAAWTLPAARGRGCLEALLRGSVRIAAQRGCVLLLAFVTRENGSSGVMRRCGSTMIPTAYLRSSPKDRRLRVDCKSLVLTAVDATEVETSFACRKAESAARFDYSRSQDWRSQYLQRPYSVETLSAGESKVIVEKVGDTDRLVLLIGPRAERRRVLAALAWRARQAGRNFFAFTMDPSDHELAGEEGWRSRPGYLAALGVARGRPAPVATLPELREIAADRKLKWPDPALALGPWQVHPGDRM